MVALRQDRPPPRVWFKSVRSATVAASRKLLHKAPLAFRAIFTNALEIVRGRRAVLARRASGLGIGCPP